MPFTPSYESNLNPETIFHYQQHDAHNAVKDVSRLIKTQQPPPSQPFSLILQLQPVLRLLYVLVQHGRFAFFWHCGQVNLSIVLISLLSQTVVILHTI